MPATLESERVNQECSECGGETLPWSSETLFHNGACFCCEFCLKQHQASEGESTALDRPADDYIDIVFGGPPAHESGRFVEVEDSSGQSFKAGEWVERDDGYWCLRLPVGRGALETR